MLNPLAWSRTYIQSQSLYLNPEGERTSQCTSCRKQDPEERQACAHRAPGR